MQDASAGDMVLPSGAEGGSLSTHDPDKRVSCESVNRRGMRQSTSSATVNNLDTGADSDLDDGTRAPRLSSVSQVAYRNLHGLAAGLSCHGGASHVAMVGFYSQSSFIQHAQSTWQPR
jgi:hypothetical protein